MLNYVHEATGSFLETGGSHTCQPGLRTIQTERRSYQFCQTWSPDRNGSEDKQIVSRQPYVDHQTDGAGKTELLAEAATCFKETVKPYPST